MYRRECLRYKVVAQNQFTSLGTTGSSEEPSTRQRLQRGGASQGEIFIKKKLYFYTSGRHIHTYYFSLSIESLYFPYLSIMRLLLISNQDRGGFQLFTSDNDRHKRSGFSLLILELDGNCHTLIFIYTM